MNKPAGRSADTGPEEDPGGDRAHHSEELTPPVGRAVEGVGDQTTSMGPAEFFAGHPLGSAVFFRVRSVLERLGPVDIRTTKSQVAFRRVRGFACLWLPGRYLAAPSAEVVLSFALGRRDPSPRLKEVVHPSPNHWMHHLEIHDVDEVDDEVVAWLREAAERSG